MSRALTLLFALFIRLFLFGSSTCFLFNDQRAKDAAFQVLLITQHDRCWSFYHSQRNFRSGIIQSYNTRDTTNYSRVHDSQGWIYMTLRTWNKVRSTEIRKSLNIELLLLQIRRSQLMLEVMADRDVWRVNLELLRNF